MKIRAVTLGFDLPAPDAVDRAEWQTSHRACCPVPRAKAGDTTIFAFDNLSNTRVFENTRVLASAGAGAAGFVARGQ